MEMRGGTKDIITPMKVEKSSFLHFMVRMIRKHILVDQLFEAHENGEERRVKFPTLEFTNHALL